MIKLLKKAIKTGLVKISSFTAVSTFVKMITGFTSVKVVAVIIGPNVLALLGRAIEQFFFNVYDGGIRGYK